MVAYPEIRESQRSQIVGAGRLSDNTRRHHGLIWLPIRIGRRRTSHLTLCRNWLIRSLGVGIVDRALMHAHQGCVHAIDGPGSHISALSIPVELHLHLVLLLLYVELLLLMKLLLLIMHLLVRRTQRLKRRFASSIAFPSSSATCV
jgi:hypothetical protein